MQIYGFSEKQRCGRGKRGMNGWIASVCVLCMCSSYAGAGIDPSPSEQRIELIFWESVQDSTSAADYEAYLEAYPEGKFAALARARVSQYGKVESPATTSAIAVTQPAQKLPQAETTPVDTLSAAPKQYPLEQVTAPYELIEMSNVRERPSAGAPIITVLNIGDPIEVTDRVSGRNWYKIRLDDGAAGYIYGELVQPAVPATPAPQAQ